MPTGRKRLDCLVSSPPPWNADAESIRQTSANGSRRPTQAPPSKLVHGASDSFVHIPHHDPVSTGFMFRTKFGPAQWSAGVLFDLQLEKFFEIKIYSSIIFWKQEIEITSVRKCESDASL